MTFGWQFAGLGPHVLVPAWEIKLIKAVGAGIERFQAMER